MNIGLLIPSLKNGGAEKFVVRLAEALSEYHNVFVINYLPNRSTFEGKRYKIVHLTNNKQSAVLKQLLRIRSLKMIKKKYNLDVCISFLENPNLINVLSKVNGCKTYLSVRNYKSKQLIGIKGVVYGLLMKMLYIYSDLIIANSHKIKEDLIRNFNIPDRLVKVIYNIYDVKKIHKLSKEHVEPEYENIFRKKIIISMGRLDKVKGFEELIYSYMQANIDRNDVKLVIVGDGPLKTQLAALVSKYKLGRDVFLIGYKENPYKYIGKAKLFVLNSYFEGFPNALVEAMICGIPIISTNCLSGPAEIIGSGNYNLPYDGLLKSKYGFLIPTPDNDKSQRALSNAIEQLINDDNLVKKLSKLSLQRSLDFDNSKIIPNWLAIL